MLQRPDWPIRLESAMLRLSRVCLALMMAVMLAFAFGQALDRHFFKSQFDAWDQFGRVAMVWATFVGAALALGEGRNLRIDIIDRWLTPRMRAWRDMVFDLLLVVVCAVLLVKSLRVVEAGNWQVIVGTPFTYAVSYAALTAGMGLFIVFLLLRLTTRVLGVPRPAMHDDLGDGPA